MKSLIKTIQPALVQAGPQVIYQLIGGRHRHSVPSVNRAWNRGGDSLPGTGQTPARAGSNFATNAEKALINALFIEGDADCRQNAPSHR